MSYSRLAGTNAGLRINLTSVAAGRGFRIGNRNVDAGCRPAGQSRVGITVTTAMGAVLVVTEDASEPIGDVSTAVFARRVVDGWPRGDRHADHPLR